ncbi:MAG: hypothetical protein FWB86_08500 [Treponema sp.]|nr:hypothetical protein [Treponema sp.]
MQRNETATKVTNTKAKPAAPDALMRINAFNRRGARRNSARYISPYQSMKKTSRRR